MDHALRTISYIADIGDLVVLMARRMSTSHSDESCSDGFVFKLKITSVFSVCPIQLKMLILDYFIVIVAEGEYVRLQKSFVTYLNLMRLPSLLNQLDKLSKWHTWNF